MKRSKMSLEDFTRLAVLLFVIYWIITLSSCITVNIYTTDQAPAPKVEQKKEEVQKLDVVERIPGNKNYKYQN